MKFILGAGAAHCIHPHSVHCFKGNIRQFGNYLGAQAPPPPESGSDGPGNS